MTRVVMFLVLMCVMACGAGCATAGGGEVFRPAMLAPDQAVIYVFRPSERAMRSGAISVFVNQEFQCELRPGEHLAHIVGAGEYLVRVEAGGSMVTEVRVAAGNVAYEKVTMGRRSRAMIESVEPDLGRKLIMGSRRIDPPQQPAASAPAVTDRIAIR